MDWRRGRSAGNGNDAVRARTVGSRLLAATVGVLACLCTLLGLVGSASAAISAPTITASFSATTIPQSGTSTLALTINNPNSAELTGVDVSDTLPAGLTTVLGSEEYTCTGELTVDNDSFTLMGGEIPANGSCEVTVAVTPEGSGNFTDSTSAVTSSESGTGNIANASLTVVAPPEISAAFSPSTITTSGVSTLTLAITNPNTTTLTGIGVEDAIPSGLEALIGPDVGSMATTCDDASGSAGSGYVSITGGTLGPGASCTVSVQVQSQGAGHFGTFVDTSDAVSSNEGGTGGTASASLTVVAPPTISAVFTPSTISTAAGVSTLQLTLTNPNSTTSLSLVGFSDTLPSGLEVASPGNITNNCSAAPFAVDATVELTGATLAADASCVITVEVQADSAGVYTDATGAVTSSEAGTGNDVTASLSVMAPPTISASFSPTAIPSGGSSTLTFTLTNPNLNGSLTGIGFTDLLPSGLVVASPNGLSSTCGGTTTATAGSSNIVLSGVGLVTNVFCTVTVSVAGSAGNYTNTTGAVFSNEGGGGDTASASLTVNPPPVVSGIFETSGKAGDVVTITGTGFTGATAVDFGAVAATSFNVVNDTEIQGIVPNETPGDTVDVTVTGEWGTSADVGADQFTYAPVPTVTGLSTDAGPVGGGTTVTITGTGFTAGTTAVDFGGTSATSVTVVNGTTITATAPAASAGTVDVTVTTPGGTSPTSSADQFTYDNSPSVGGISPGAGPQSGGTMVTITGSGFTAPVTVSFGSTAATDVTVVSSTRITAMAPAGTGTVDIVVTTPGGASPTSAADQFTYVAAPSVTGLSTDSGPLGGGQTVTITGTGLNGVTAVSFGSEPATSFAGVSDTKLTAVVPAAAAGTADVTAVTVGGTSATSAADQYTYVKPPAVTGLSEANGDPGDVVTITGTDFIDASAVVFGGVAASSFRAVNPTTITATVPAEMPDGAVDVRVTAVGGTSDITGADAFSYVPAPAVTALSSSTGASGDTVTIIGSGFKNASGVTFGSVAATSLTVVSDTEMTAVVPQPVTAGATVYVEVTTPAGVSIDSAASSFRYTVHDTGGTDTGPATTTTLAPRTTTTDSTGTPKPPVPSNGFSYTPTSTIAKHGIVTLHLSLPGKGRVVVLETAWDSLLTHPAHGRGMKAPKRAAQPQSGLKPGPNRFTFATGTAAVPHAGKLTLSIKPNKNGALAARQNPRGYRINVWVLFTPSGGSTGTRASLRFNVSDVA